VINKEGCSMADDHAKKGISEHPFRDKKDRERHGGQNMIEDILDGL